MPLPTCKEGYIQCPYDAAHQLLESRIKFHLVKCKKVHPESRMVECPYNSLHKVPQIELNCHKNYLCPDKKKIDTLICCTEDAAPLFPVQSYNVSSSKDWVSVQVETYKPEEHCVEKPILRALEGVTSAARKNFCGEERHRYKNVIDSAGIPGVHSFAANYSKEPA